MYIYLLEGNTNVLNILLLFDTLEKHESAIDDHCTMTPIAYKLVVTYNNSYKCLMISIKMPKG